MKSYTDLEQSKKLAEILPLESADQTWARIAIAGANLDVPEELQYKHNGDMPFKYYSGIGIPCWSLTALLDVLPDSIYNNTYKFSQLEFTKKSVAYIHGTTDGIKIGALKDNLVDACYETILKLHELKML